MDDETMARLQAEATAAPVRRAWTFRPAADGREFTRGTHFPGSFYDQTGARLVNVGDADAKRFAAEILNAPDERALLLAVARAAKLGHESPARSCRLCNALAALPPDLLRPPPADGGA